MQLHRTLLYTSVHCYSGRMSLAAFVLYGLIMDLVWLAGKARAVLAWHHVACRHFYCPQRCPVFLVPAPPQQQQQCHDCWAVHVTGAFACTGHAMMLRCSCHSHYGSLEAPHASAEALGLQLMLLWRYFCGCRVLSLL